MARLTQTLQDPYVGTHAMVTSPNIECLNQYVPKAILGTSGRRWSTLIVAVDWQGMTSY